MSKVWVGVIAFVAGAAVGAYLAKLYAISTVTTDVNSLLGKVGLGGGAVQNFVDTSVIPTVIG